MKLWDDILQFFAPATAAPSMPEREPKKSDLGNEESTAWGEISSYLINANKYNPDELIGRKGFDIYKRMMYDEQVKSVMYFKRATITGRDWQFELDPEKSGLSVSEAKRRVDVFTCMLDAGYNGSFADGMNKIEKKLWQGFSFTEQVFGTFEHDGKNYWGLSELRTKPFDTFFPKLSPKGDLLYWVQRAPNAREQRIDLTKFVYHVMNPDFDEHYGQSELRSAYRAFLSKDIAIRYMNVFVERLAGGFVVATPQEGYSLSRGTPEWNALVGILSNITGKSSILLPAGVGIEVHYAPGGQLNVFKEAVDMADLAIAKSALVPNLLGITPSGHTGSYSQSDTQFDVFLIVSNAEAQRLEEVLNEQVFAPLGRVNFADGIAPRFKLKPLSKRQTAQLLTMWTELLTAGGAQASDSDEGHIRKMLEFPEKGKVLVPVEAPQQTDAPPSDAAGDRRAPPGRGTGTDANRDTRKPMTRHDFAVTRAEARVSFAVIEHKSDAEKTAHVHAIEGALADVVTEAMHRAQSLTPEEVGKFGLDGNKVRGVETRVRRMLKSGMELGADHAKREVDAAKKETFSRRLDMERLGDMAAEWMKQKSFTIAGDIQAAAVKEIKGALVRGLKKNSSFQEVKLDVYKSLVQKGILGGRSAAQALGEGDTERLGELLDLKTDLEPYRLDTIVRTNMFEAINESRFNLFTDPELSDFVTGMEYSAVLDSRTTQLCETMNGRAYSSDMWEGELRDLVPPNHFNCRSILIPITTQDEQDFDEEVPDVQSDFG